MPDPVSYTHLPHFIYNVLNVISNRGIINGDEQICEICGSLAAMLRYSTSTIAVSYTHLFGQNMSAHIQVTAEGKAGDAIELWCFEELDARCV